MAIFICGDLHLGFSCDKPMDIFGERWKNHHLKLKESFEKAVKPEDLVILAGDLSWGKNLKESIMDLDFIRSLPGKKLLVKGNHDYFWESKSKMQKLYPEFTFLQGSSYLHDGVAIVGSRGWNYIDLTKSDQKIYNREVLRLTASIEEVKKFESSSIRKIIGVMHFPPVYTNAPESDFVDLFRENGVFEVYYGHLHGNDKFEVAVNGMLGGISYNLISSDFLDFKLLRID